MPGPSPFREYWRDALRAHYLHVVRTGDRRTESTLRGLLRDQLGFSEAELQALYIQATMHVDQVGADFVPDEAFIRALEAEAHALIQTEPPPVTPETIAAIAEQMDARRAEPDHEPADLRPARPADDRPDEPDPPAEPTQLSLF
ncbi:MAG: hypothetical protein ACUVS2_14065 [Candidatus Flexifilum sp.]|jgi:hypothetical protein